MPADLQPGLASAVTTCPERGAIVEDDSREYRHRRIDIMSSRRHYLPRMLMIGAAAATVVAAPVAVAQTASAAPVGITTLKASPPDGGPTCGRLCSNDSGLGGYPSAVPTLVAPGVRVVQPGVIPVLSTSGRLPVLPS
jgi:hypothetical protein